MRPGARSAAKNSDGSTPLALDSDRAIERIEQRGQRLDRALARLARRASGRARLSRIKGGK